MKNGIWVFDVEADSLNPTKIHCLSANDPTKAVMNTTSSYDDMRKFLLNAKVLIGHNITRWDIPHLERLLGIKIKAKIVDTLALSWYLYPKRPRHGLEFWGEDFGVPKPKINDWVGLSQEEYEHRCQEDVKINTLLWNKMYQYLLKIYGSDKEIWKLLDYISLKMHCARLQEVSQWKLDVEKAQESLDELLLLQEDKKVNLADAMPLVPDVRLKSKPIRFINKEGDYTKLGMEWIALLAERGLPPTHEEPVEIIKGYQEGNPSSPDQVKNWLYSLGWVPQTFKSTKDSEGNNKQIPQINLEHGKGICPSIKMLYDKEPNLELLEGLSVLQHRIGILKGFLRDNNNGWITAQVDGLTNTLRFQHRTIVNLPKVRLLHALPIRSSLICSDGKILCGADLSSLEDKIKQHLIYPLDPEYVKSLQTPGYDPHLEIARIAGMLTVDQIVEYKWYASLEDNEKLVADKVRMNLAKAHKAIRDIAKNGNYACQYGAGAARLMITCGISREAATTLYEAYWKLNWAVRAVAKSQKFKEVDGQLWLFNPISELWYSLRFERDIFSTLVQGTGSYIFDIWLEEVLKRREQVTGQFHDEFILSIRDGAQEECTKMINEAILEVNKRLNLNVEITCGIQYGYRYSEIH